MNPLEKYLSESASIPFNEGAYFYIGVRQPVTPGGEKTAAPTREQLEDASDKGALSGVTQAKKNIVVDRESRGERTGKAVGNVLGTLGGAAAGHRLMGKSPGAALAGAAMGYVAGGSAGKEIGRGRDIARHSRKPKSIKEAAVRMRFKLAAMKLAQPPIGEPAEAPMSSPSDTQQLQPSNYLQAEMMGQQSQQAQESEFYKSRAQSAEQAAQQAAQQAQEAQMQAEQSQQQLQPMMGQAMQAQDEALKQTQVAANMRMGMQKLRQQMLEVASQDPAEVASQELQAQLNPQPAAAPGAEDPSAAGGGPPSSPAEAEKETEEAARAQNDAAEQTAQAEQAQGGGPPVAPPPQGTPPPGGAASPSGGADVSTMEPSGGLKAAGVMQGMAHGAMQLAKERLPWAVAGAAVGAAGGAGYGQLRGPSTDRLRQRVQQLEAQENGGFRRAMQLAAAQNSLAAAEERERNPARAMAGDAASGAIGGAAAGALLGKHLPRLAREFGR